MKLIRYIWQRRNFNVPSSLLITRCRHAKSDHHHHHRHHDNEPVQLSYVPPRSGKPLVIETIGQRIDQAAELYQDRDSFVDFQTGERLTFIELKEKAEDLASGLIAIGLKRGDRLGLWAPNCMEWILTQYAAAVAGIILVNINPAYKTLELEYSLNKVGCKAIIMSQSYKNQNYVNMIMELCPELHSCKPGDLKSKRVPELRSAILISDIKPFNGFFLFEQIQNGGDSNHRQELAALKKKLQSSDAINIQYTSGTTGFPKGVTLTHHMLLNNAFQIGYTQEYDKHRTIICQQAPLYHCLGMVFGSMSTITHGATCVLPYGVFNAEQSLRAIQAERCTTVYGTPTMFIDMYTHPNFENYDVSSLNAGIMAGSTCPIEIVHKCIKKLNTKYIVVAYGLTETSPLITVSERHDSLEHRTQTIGKVVEHQEVKLVDKEGNIVPINEPGELLIRGYNTMVGYWNDKEKTEETYTHDRFLKTGDVVRMDKNGYFHHESRLKDMIIRGGENIYPKEIEEFLHKHPKIADVYVVGVPDKRMGEELCACVKLSPNETMNIEELRSFCKDKIAHFKVPRYVEFMDEFPTTVSGKVQKNKLKKIVMKRLNIHDESEHPKGPHHHRHH